MGVIIFNGLSSKDYGIEVWQAPDYQIPERDYETVHVPGRDGDLVIDKESFKNTSRSYTVSIGKNDKGFTSLANRLAQWLHSPTGYARLEDSYEPDYYRQAIYKRSASITNIYEKAGYTTIEFNCKPQRYLKSGDRVIRFVKKSPNIEDSIYENVLDASNNCIEGCVEQIEHINNPTLFKSRPIIKVYGNGSGEIKIGSQTIAITSIDEYLIIDCDMMEIYKDGTNCNKKVKLSDNSFPKLVPGINEISFSGEITALEVTPKWWTI